MLMKFSQLLAAGLASFTLVPLAISSAPGEDPRECGTDSHVILDSPYEKKGVRKAGQTDAEVAADVSEALADAWKDIVVCAECTIEGGCKAFTGMTYTSTDVLPNPTEPDVLVKFYGGLATIGCTKCE